MSGHPTEVMVKKATGRPLSQDEKEEWMSMPASSSRSNTPKAQAQTQDPFQPLDYFHEGERTMSPPPVALEKAIDPSLDSQPDTPSASSTSCLSRTSTLNSFSTVQTQDSDTTLCSQSTQSSDDTVSVSRSRTFPAMGSYPNDRKILPKGTDLRIDLPRSLHKQQTIFPFPIGVSVPLAQSVPGRSNTYLRWPGDQGGTPVPSNQTAPSRHLTFPIERPRNPTILEDTQPSMPEKTEEETVSESSGLGNPLAKDMNNSSTDMCYNVVMQEVPPDDAELASLQAETDVFLKSRMITSERRMFGLLDSKQTGLEFKLDPIASFLSQRRKNLHRNRPASKTRRSLASQNYQADIGRPCSPGGNVLSAASTIPTPESMEEPEHISKNEPLSQTEEIQGSRSPSPSLPQTLCGEDNRESSSQDSDDDATFPHEGCSPVNENDDDSAYDHLVESITNLVLESSCVGNVEERAVPIELYVHNLLEQIMNHTKAANKSQAFCLPIRNLPIQNSGAPGDVGDADVHARDQGGNAGSSNGNKRKNKAASGQGRNHGYEDEESLDDSSEEDQGNNTQKPKKLKTGKKSHNFSCPFRKRNPNRFNVREHSSCALNPFADFALLKRHIKTSHQRAKGLISCFRCKETFTDQAALRHHLTQPESCTLLIPTEDEDPEDGITDEVDRALKVRTKDDNIGSWKGLWEHLFPDDNLDNIPGPDHEPPVELDEVQHHAYKGDLVRKFVHEQIMKGETKITEHGFQYLVEVAQHCRHVRSHKPFKGREDRDEEFVKMVRIELNKRHCVTQPQQTHPPPMVVCDSSHGVAPNPWDPNLVNFLSLAGNPAFLDGHFSNPVMTGYTDGFGVGTSQDPAPNLGPSSEHPSQHAAPQYAPTASPYKDMLAQNDRPCSAAEGSAGRSSGPSSQTHDSGYQTSQEQNAAALLQNHQHAPDPQYGDTGCYCSFSTPLGEIPGQHATIAGQGSSDLRGVFTGPFMPECADAGSNSEEEISPLPHIQ